MYTPFPLQGNDWLSSDKLFSIGSRTRNIMDRHTDGQIHVIWKQYNPPQACSLQWYNNYLMKSSADLVLKSVLLTLCMLGNFACFFVVCGFFFFFFNWLFQRKSFRNTIRVSNRLDPDQARCFYLAWSGSKLFAKVISRCQNSPHVWKELRWIF